MSRMGMLAAGGLAPLAHGPFAVLLGVTALAWVIPELRQALTRRSEAVTADRGSLMVLRAAFVGGALVAVSAERVLPAAAIQPAAAGAWLGLAFLWSGIVLRLWSFRTLGRYFTFTVQTSRDQPVIRAGPYRFVRHPGYTGLLLAIIGVSFFFGNWVSTVGLAIAATAGLVYRIRVEERALVQTLGDTYRDYAATRKRLVPLLW
jgi:protein-S-isoprenylcysteine O-methyltransferase Ste14